MSRNIYWLGTWAIKSERFVVVVIDHAVPGK